MIKEIPVSRENHTEIILAEELENTAESGRGVDFYHCLDCRACHRFDYIYHCEKRHRVYRPRECKDFELRPLIERDLFFNLVKRPIYLLLFNQKTKR